MADQNADSAVTATLTAASVDVVTLANDFPDIEVVNVSGDAEIYYLIEPGATNPTVGGDDCHLLPASVSSRVSKCSPGAGTVIKLISSGTPKYHVAGVRSG